MRVLLVHLPWAPIEIPSLALGILRRIVSDRISSVDVDVLYANIDYVDWISERHEFECGDYRFYALDSYFLGAGDWVFSGALYDKLAWRVTEFTTKMAGKISSDRIRLSATLQEHALLFVQQLVERIAAAEPDVVGFTTTFQQNTAALATAKHLKRLAPQIVTIFGGANCEAEQGAALHRNFPFVDFVVRGEAELVFPRLLTALSGRQTFHDLEGLCWRAPDGSSLVNPMSTRPVPPTELVTPDYDSYFDRLAASRARHWADRKLVVESARGCWWGEKHHCTFCGLNGSFMQFRSRSPESFLAEITALAERHQVLDVMMVDNILDMAYLDSLMPRLADAGYDLRLHYEIKANMRRDQLRTLVDAGVTHVQPGIESLSSRVLSLMDKGTTGCLNVRLLRDAESVGLTVVWNYLYGFPGETNEDYLPVLDQIRALHHLAPPSSHAARINIERFSPYFNKPALGFAELRPAAHYRMIYDLPEDELFDLAYMFDAPDRGVGEEIGDLLGTALLEWEDCYPSSRCTYCDLSDRVLLVNRRPHFDWRTLCIDDPVELAIFRLLDQPRTVTSLTRNVTSRPDLPPVTIDSVTELLQRWRALGIVFQDRKQFIHVATEATNQELLRIDHASTGRTQTPAVATPA